MKKSTKCEGRSTRKKSAVLVTILVGAILGAAPWSVVAAGQQPAAVQENAQPGGLDEPASVEPAEVPPAPAEPASVNSPETVQAPDPSLPQGASEPDVVVPSVAAEDDQSTQDDVEPTADPDVAGDGPVVRIDGRGRPVVRIGQNVTIPAGDSVREVVVVLGSATIAGNVDRDVVVTMGAVRLESTARIGGSLVVTGGDLTIADGAVVNRDLVVTGGTVSAPAGFSPGREYVAIGIPGLGVRVQGFVEWVTRGLIWGRLIVPSLTWVWVAVALAVFVYFLINLLFTTAVKACSDVVGERPLSTFLTGLLVLVLVGPVAFILSVSVIGIPVIPFVLCGMFVAALVGKVGVTRWLGAGLVSESDPLDRGQATRSFLIGTAVILAAYMVPVVGILTWLVGSTFGLGAATIAFSSALRREMPAPPPAPEAGSVPAGPPPPPPEGGPSSTVGHAVYRAPVVAATTDWESGAPTPGSDVGAIPLPAPAAPSVAEGRTAPAGTLTSTFPKAPFLDRLGAFAIDILLVSLVQGLLDVGTFRGFVTLLLGYHILFWTLKQTTVGGMILNLRVVRTDGQPLSFADALIRGLSSIFSIAALGIGCFWILIDPDNQSWHDRFAGTWVVKVPKNWTV